MANVKISALPSNASPATNDTLVSYDTSSNTDVQIPITDLIALFNSNPPSTSWQLLGSNILAVSGNTLTVASFAAMTYLQILISIQGTGGTVAANMTFNGDTAGNYAYRASANGAADTTSVSQTAAVITGAATYNNLLFTANIINIGTQEALVSGIRSDTGTAGAGNAPNKAEFSMKWANTTTQITTITVTNTGAGTYNIGSALYIYGHN